MYLQKYVHPLIITKICKYCNIPKAKAKNKKQNIQFQSFIQFMLLITRDNNIKYIEFEKTEIYYILQTVGKIVDSKDLKILTN